MNNLLATFWKALIAGLGFSAGIAAIFFCVSFFLSKSPTDLVNENELVGKVQATVSEVRFSDGHIVILGTLENGTEWTFEKVNVSALVYEGEKLIDQCGGYNEGLTKPKEQSQFVIRCTYKSVNTDKSKIAVRAKVINALRNKGA